MNSIIKCPNCNSTEHKPNAKFCHVCGTELSGTMFSMLQDIEAIDLGLPSGTKWANMNVGAVSPEDYGNYYSWGETEEKDVYEWRNYIYGAGRNSCDCLSNIQGSNLDVAHVKWGDGWMTPTHSQIEELVRCCSYKWIKVHEKNCGVFTSKINGNNILLPMAGNREGSGQFSLVGQGYYGAYWSSTQKIEYDYCAYGLFFDGGNANGNASTERYEGWTIRPVRMD